MMTDMDSEDDDVLLEGMMDLVDELGGDDDLDASLADAMAEANALLDSEDRSSLDKTIQTMAATQLCVHPEHSHSFSIVTFTFGATRNKKCAGCGQRFKSSVFSSSDTTGKVPADASVLKCVACGAFAHRSCALSPSTKWNEVCPVNGPFVKEVAKAMLITDDERDNDQEGNEDDDTEVVEFEVDLEAKLTNDDESKSKTAGGRIPSRNRNSSFASSSNSDESMTTQELEDEEADELLGMGDLVLREDSNEPSQDEACTASPQLSPTSRRAISGLLFANKRRADGADNPYVDANDDDEGSEQNENDHSAQGNEGGVRKPRTWFVSKSPVVEKAIKGKRSEEEGGDEQDPTNSTRSRKWFSSSKRNNGKDKKLPPEEETCAADDDRALHSPRKGKTVSEELQQPATVPPAKAWLSSAANAVQEDYGEDVEGMSNSQQEDVSATDRGQEDIDEIETSDSTGRRGWFQRKTSKSALTEGGNTSEPPGEGLTSSSARFALFSKNRSGPKANPGLAAKKSNISDPTDDDDLTETPNEVEVEFSNFLDVEDPEELREAAKKKETEATTEFSNFLDVDENNELAYVKEKDIEPTTENSNGDRNSETEELGNDEAETDDAAPQSEEKRSRVSIGLFRRQKCTAGVAPGHDMCDEKDIYSSGNDGHEGSSHVAQDEEKENSESRREMDMGGNVAQPMNSSSAGKLRFRLFSKKSDDLSKNAQRSDDKTTGTVMAGDQETTDAELHPNKPAIFTNSLRSESSNASEDSDDASDRAELRECTSTELSESSELPAKNDATNKPSLLSRVFSPSKTRNQVDEAVESDDADNEHTTTSEATLDESTPRRFLRFSSGKKGTVSPEDANKERDMNPDAKASPRIFSLFGFGRGGKDALSGESQETVESLQSWASDEPPSHWTTATTPSFQRLTGVAEQGHDVDAEKEREPIHYANHPFASVSRALEDNILALHGSEGRSGKSKEKLPPVDVDSEDESANHASSRRKTPSSLSLIVSPDLKEPSNFTDLAIGEIRPKPEIVSETSTLMKVASGTYDAVVATAKAQNKMGVASVAGGIAGGVAGLMFAGPAGAVMGVRYGQTAGVLGVLLEGSITVGVIVAGVAGGRFTAERIQEQIEEQRVLTIGENGVARKVMLVRPTIRIDPAWHDICAEAQRTAPSNSSSVFSFFSTCDDLKQERYERTSDICEEDDIPTEEKVLLLASRVLSDKDSFPGHVYRCVMQAFKDRCKQRAELRHELANNKEDFPHLFEEGSEGSVNMGDGMKLSLSPRARREDAHGVIKYITGTLLEVRPGLASTPEITETTAAVVEALVFGEVYDLVYEEIAIEATERDKMLLERIDDFEFARHERTGKPLPTAGVVSKEAIAALRRLPESHAAAEKLRHCVVFLERLSDHFATMSSKSAMGADSLLKMVCQHIIAAKMSYVNAEVAFLEEFARDEQLLRGREGYALVTLQASLHFLNMSYDFERDIFGQDNDEENKPISNSNSEEGTATADVGLADTEPKVVGGEASEEAEDHLDHQSTASSDEKSISELEAREEKKEEPEQEAEEDLL